MMRIGTTRLAILAASLALAPASAQAGFFDQLFGAPPPSRAPAYEPAAPQLSPDSAPVPLAPRKKIVRETAPARQKTTDLMHDKTLRPGDAVMMKTGLAIYGGPESARHNAGQFTPLDRSSGLSKGERSALIAMDATRHDPLRTGLAPDTLASGRSAAVAVPITDGYRITDARGASIRYVGP